MEKPKGNSGLYKVVHFVYCLHYLYFGWVASREIVQEIQEVHKVHNFLEGEMDEAR